MFNQIINNLNTQTAEEVFYGINTDPAYAPVSGSKPSYEEYDTDIDLVKKFRFKLNLPDCEVDVINYTLNRKALKYSGREENCPTCGKALDLVGNDGHFCKFCGTHISRPVNTTFGDELRKKRLKMGLKQGEFAALVNKSASVVCNLEKNNRTPSDEDLIEFSHLFKCSVNSLFGQDAPRVPAESIVPENMRPYQETFSSETAPIKEADVSGYIMDDEYIFRCPHCESEVDLTPMESLTLGLPSYEVMKMRTHGNDGHYCKHCGQKISRPVEIDEDKALAAYSYWIRWAIRKSS